MSPNPFRSILKRYRHRRQESRTRKEELLRQRDQERTSGTGDGLLRIALQRHNSVNSFTAADPARHYRKGRAWDNM
ncbi:hypothetical protein Slin15195_G125320 [Septoria linicola]|uniref:Uncharacterized protein n=1 Tax=Septoria linicola TaxID=215465 RepID=A0A9Q9B597_9PEZI|nr:hypothetical protein Slin14017_G081510 [Septoria linicola]USW59213.1 hypothetical protein Slin15195_G125320 [Septoria linicola]